MTYKLISTTRFEKEFKRLYKKYPSLKSEFTQLISAILLNPESGKFLGNNCFKIRLAISSKGKGKSGGARVITYFYKEANSVYLLTIYDKGEKNDLLPNELKNIIDSLSLNF